MDLIFLIGRILLGGYFLYNSYNHLVNTKQLAGYAAFKRVPMPTLAVFGSGLLLLCGALSILTGTWIVSGVVALTLFLIPVTFQMHAFWKEEGDGRAMEKVQFMKNTALLGAVLTLLMIPEPWAYSLNF